MLASRTCHAGFSAFVLAAAVAFAPTPALAGPGTCSYALTIRGESANSLDIAVECDGSQRPTDFRFLDPIAAKFAQSAIAPDGRRTFRIDLDALAAEAADYDSALRVGRSLLLAPATIIPVPAEGGPATKLELQIISPDGAGFATALPGDDKGRYEFAGIDLEDAGEFVLGKFVERTIAGQSGMRLAILDAPMAAGTESLARWVSDVAASNSRFWHRPPIDHPLVVLLPMAGETGLPYGRVMSAGGAVVLVQVGDSAPVRQLYDEWVLVHEFIHLGSPLVRDTGPWFNEGIATYFEPIIRVRAGWRDADSVWKEWLTNMPRGLPALTGAGLESADHGGIYWGGALFMLLADLKIRERSDGRLGVEDCLVDIRAKRGNVTEKATTDQVLAACDDKMASRVLNDLAAQYVHQGAPVDLESVWRSLGVAMDASGAIVYSDQAPLAWLRRAIIDGGRDRHWEPIPRPASVE